VKTHPFFHGIDWGDLALQQVEAPELPKVNLEFEDAAKLVKQTSKSEQSMHDRLMDDTSHYEDVGYVAEDVFWVDGF
jgi:hypothetical protein